jgi:hypothetical protein
MGGKRNRQRAHPSSKVPPNRLARPGKPASAKYIAINAFLIFHILAITCWAIPLNTRFTSACRELVRPYLAWSGLFQSWDMFSPTPKSQNMYLEAIIIYRDGSTDLWTFPRMELLSLTQRYFKERYRKYEETLDDDRYSALWPDAARHIARMKASHSSPPKTIMLVVRWSDIIPRTDGGYDRGPWGVRVLYRYDVQPGDLK